MASIKQLVNHLKENRYQEHDFLSFDNDGDAESRVTEALDAYSGPISIAHYKATVSKIALGGHALQFLTTRGRLWSQVVHPGRGLSSAEKNATAALNRYYEMLKSVGSGFLEVPITKNCISKNDKVFSGLKDIFYFASRGGNVNFSERVISD